MKTAGKRDIILLNSEIVSKRFMLMAVLKAYLLYKEQFGSNVISRCFFFFLIYTCVFPCHVNVAFLLEGCAKIIPTFSTDYQTFLKSVCCDVDNEDCMTAKCEKCVWDIQDGRNWQNWRKIGGTLSDLLYELQEQLSLFKLNFL